METAQTSEKFACPPKVRKGGLLSRLGPGLITGASDDDPSGIATYSQAGAAFAYGLLWTIVLSLPLMAAIQEISARVGRVTGHGIAGNIRRHYSRWLLYPLVLLLLIANTINIGADIGAMGDATKLLIGGPALLYSIIFALLAVALQVFGSYSRCCTIFKGLSIALVGYILTTFMVHVPWGTALKSAVMPTFGATANTGRHSLPCWAPRSAPIFFSGRPRSKPRMSRTDQQTPGRSKNAPEQAPKEFDRIRFDTYVGMTFSNLVAFFIIIAAAATLNAHGTKTVDTSAQAAEALRPIAGKAAFVIFALGIIGTGLLAVPVLAGSTAYAVGEAFHWRTGMDQKPHAARGFYLILTLSTVLGLCINFPEVQKVIHLTPIRALFWSAVINGIAAVPIMVMVMLMARSETVMGKDMRVSTGLNVVGWLATAVMAAGAVMIFVTWKS